MTIIHIQNYDFIIIIVKTSEIITIIIINSVYMLVTSY
jgi:hypothetical protein